MFLYILDKGHVLHKFLHKGAHFENPDFLLRFKCPDDKFVYCVLYRLALKNGIEIHEIV